MMKNKEAIELILEFYNRTKEELIRFKKLRVNYDWLEGQLCAMRYVLIYVYGFKNNDKRF